MPVKVSWATLHGVLFSTLLALSACSDGGSSTSSSTGGITPQPVTPPPVVQPLTPTEATKLSFVREEEKLARDVYLTLYSLWGNAIFQNIATRSEQKHMDQVKSLLDAAALPDPIVDDTVGVFSDSTIATLYSQLVARGRVSTTEALAVGAYIEEFDIDDLQQAMAQVLQGSNQFVVLQTYDSLLCGSRNHLRSFVKQLDGYGVSYRAQLLNQATVDWIVGSPQEQCGGDESARQ